MTDETSNEDDIPLAQLATTPRITITREIVGGTEAQTIVYTAKDGTDWSSTPLAPTAQTSAVNIFNLLVDRIPQTQNRTTPAEVFQLFITSVIPGSQSMTPK